MARRPSSTITQPQQPSFFDAQPMPLMELDGAIREALGETLALAKVNLGLDRHDIAAEVNRLQPVPDRELTKNMLDRFSAPGSGDWQLPAWRVPAICRVTEDFRLLTLLVEACDHKAVPSEAAKVAEDIMLAMEQKRIQDRRAALRKEMSPAALEWVPVVSMTTTAPPGAPAAGDTYLVPAEATGAWAAQVGKLAEWAGSAWRYTTPANGHGIGLPDGRIFQRIAGTYVEFTASRLWVEARKTPVSQLLWLPWLPVVSMTTTAPPGAPAAGDTYLVPAAATGAWAGHAGKLAEWSGSAWALTTPANGHGICLPDGRVFVRVAGSYVEKIAADVQSGKWNYAAGAGTANAMTATLTPAPASLAAMVGAPVRIKKGAAVNTAAVTLNLNGLGVKPVVQVDGSALAAGALPANCIFEVVYDGTNFQLVSASAAAPTIFGPTPVAPTAVIDLQETEGLFEAMAGHIASTSGGTVQCGVDISFDNGATWVALYQDNNVSPGENALLIISVKGGTYRALMMQTNSTAVTRAAGSTGTVTNLRIRARAATGNVTYSEFWIRKAG